MKNSKIYVAVIAIAGTLLVTSCKKDATQAPSSKYHSAELATGPDSSGGQEPPIPPK